MVWHACARRLLFLFPHCLSSYLDGEVVRHAHHQRVLDVAPRHAERVGRLVHHHDVLVLVQHRVLQPEAGHGLLVRGDPFPASPGPGCRRGGDSGPRRRGVVVVQSPPDPAAAPACVVVVVVVPQEEGGPGRRGEADGGGDGHDEDEGAEDDGVLLPRGHRFMAINRSTLIVAMRWRPTVPCSSSAWRPRVRRPPTRRGA